MLPTLLTARPGPRTLLLTALALLIAVATIMLACGPAAQPIPEEGDTFTAAPQAEGGGEEPAAEPEEPTATPTVEPTDTPTPEAAEPVAAPVPASNYPKLDGDLQDLVRQFEAGELTESQAAAQAPMHHISSLSVLVQVNIQSSAVAGMEAWLSSNNVSPRHTVPGSDPNLIYGYVRVSLLGPLSQQTGVIQVQSIAAPVAPPGPPAPGGQTSSDAASGASGSESTSTPEPAEPELPLWLAGFPYPNLLSPLDRIVYRYEQGELTEADAAAETGYNRGSAVFVEINLLADPVNTESVATWLKGKGVSPLAVSKPAESFNLIVAFVPVSLLGKLSNQTGIVAVDTPQEAWNEPGTPPGPSGAADQPPPSQPTPTPQGFAAHGANGWYNHTTPYRGNGVKIGIIDSGFDGYRSLMGIELPATVTARCYTSYHDTIPSSNIDDCGGINTDAEYHGTGVAQAVFDIAPGASLYISNASMVTGAYTRSRLWSDVLWMARNGVKVINYSQGWTFEEGLGDGVARVPVQFSSIPIVNVNPLDTIDKAVEKGILWVNAAGNDNQRIWHGTFNAGTPSDQYHYFAPNNARNFITFSGTQRSVRAELRWDDSWGGANCNLNLELYDAASGTPLETSRRNQNGGAGDIPYERIVYETRGSGNYYVAVSTGKCTDANDLGWMQLSIWQPNTLEHSSTGYSISFPAESKNPGLLAVGAANWATPRNIQTSSSRGPTTDGRIKPDIVGADCAKARFFTEHPSGCWFSGTSQAAPHVAGLAALVLSRFPDYTPAEVATYLKENAESRTQEPAPNNTDPNNVWGHGFAKLPAPSLEAGFTTKPTTIQVGQSLSFTLDLDDSQSSAKIVVNNPGDTGKLHTVGSCPGTNVNTASRENVINDGASLAITGCSVGTSTIRIYHVGTRKLLNIYSVTVSATARLSGLTISPGSLAETFAGGTTAYTAQVDNNVSRVTVTPSTTTPGATIRVGTAQVTSGSSSGSIALSVGDNAISIAVSATGYTSRTYTITVTRAPAPLLPPTGLSLSTVSGETGWLRLTYTRSQAPHNYEFELHYLNKVTGKYVRYQSELDSRSPETFENVGRGYWYKAKGRNCRNTSQSDTCGVWSDWSSEVELSDPTIAISGLTSSYIAGDRGAFNVTLSDLTLNQSYTVTFTTNNSSIGSNYRCNNLPSRSFTALGQKTLYLTLHTCQPSGSTATATVTAQLRKGGSSGNSLDTATATVTVAKATGSLSSVPTTIIAGHDRTLTLTTNVPNSPGVWVSATVSGDRGQLTLPPTRGCYHAISSFTAVNGNTLTLRGCKVGTARLTLYRNHSAIQLASYTVTVTASNTQLSPPPTTFIAGHDQTFALTTDIANDPGVWITATVAGDAGRTTLPPTRGCHQSTSGLAAVDGNTITIRGCRAGTATITIHRSNSSVLLKSYTVTVVASNTELSPEPATFTAGHDQTFTLTTDIANDPGVWITATVAGDAGQITLPPTRGCYNVSSGLAAIDGNTITIRGCRAGTATINIRRSNSSVLLKSYTVTVVASNTELSPEPATFTIGTNQTFTLTTDIPNNPGVWVGLNYNPADTGRLVMSDQSCTLDSGGTAAVNGSSITLKPCRAGTVTIMVNRSYSSVTLVSYTVTINSS